MLSKIRRYLGALANQPDAYNVSKAIDSLYRNQVLNSAGLGIQGGSAAATWATANVVNYMVEGVNATLAAQSSKAVPSAITWAAVASTFQAGAFLVTVDNAGTVATVPTNVGTGTSAAIARANIVWPVVPDGQVVVGVVIIANSAANVAFTAASTNLDATNISTTFINTIGPFYPTTANQ